MWLFKQLGGSGKTDRRRVSKGNGKKTLGWICKRDDTDKVLENIDFYKLKTEKNKLKEISNERNKNA